MLATAQKERRGLATERSARGRRGQTAGPRADGQKVPGVVELAALFQDVATVLCRELPCRVVALARVSPGDPGAVAAPGEVVRLLALWPATAVVLEPGGDSGLAGLFRANGCRSAIVVPLGCPGSVGEAPPTADDPAVWASGESARRGCAEGMYVLAVGLEAEPGAITAPLHVLLGLVG